VIDKCVSVRCSRYVHAHGRTTLELNTLASSAGDGPSGSDLCTVATVAVASIIFLRLMHRPSVLQQVTQSLLALMISFVLGTSVAFLETSQS